MPLNVDRSRDVLLSGLAHKMNVHFYQLSLFDQALTHTSYSHEQKNGKYPHNERLEFLGDAVLELVISQHLYCSFPNATEGDLTRYRAAVVCEASLAQVALDLHLGEYLLLGKGEDTTGGRNRPSILADAVEAVIGAIYLDAGLDQATAFIIAQLTRALPAVEDGTLQRDHKTQLQELIQKQHKHTLEYEIIAATGPDHKKMFTARVKVDGTELGCGQGHSKKEAEQSAAAKALSILQEN